MITRCAKVSLGTKCIHFAAFLKGVLAQVSKILPAFTWPRSHKRENDGDHGVHVNLSVSLLGLSKKLGCKTCAPRKVTYSQTYGGCVKGKT